MKWFMDLKISIKLLSAFIIVAILAGGVGIVGMTNIKTIDENSHIMYNNMTVPLGEAAEMAKLFQRVRVNTRDMILENDVDEIESMYSNIEEIIEELNVLSDDFGERAITDEMKEAFDHFLDTRADFADTLPAFKELCLNNQDVEAYDMIKGEMRLAADAEKDAIDVLVNINVVDAKAKSDANDESAASATSTMIILIIVAVLLAVGLGLLISRIISKPLGKIVIAANQIANGDLNTSIDIDNKDEIGMLARAFSTMSSNINQVMTNISSASEHVASGSRQVSESSMSLSQGATEQASSIEELTASVEEIASQTEQNAGNANKAKEVTESAKLNASHGNNQMQEMLTAMEDINESSKNISKIIKVIDDIAFQTNILALNAAVEAARAGQHGKGFAVVAEEVRNLAARSANAAKETTAMIEGSISKVEGGRKIANDTAEALNTIVSDVSTAAELVGQIAVASGEQAQGVGQINEGLTQISAVVQTTSATAEETAAASEELSSQADLLRNQVGTFSLQNINSAYGDEEISPDVLKMLDKMKPQEVAKTVSKHSKKISLSDSDFEKY